jgi:hypothetical protein
MWPRVDPTSFEPTAESERMSAAPEIVTRTLETLALAAGETGARWALVGGQALIAHGVPRDTLDADALVDGDLIGELALDLVEKHGWTALDYDASVDDYRDVAHPIAHFMDDPVLFDIAAERTMYPLRSDAGLLVELLAAQHPTEVQMVAEAAIRRHFGASIPVAPLGGVLLVKAKADRTKDVAALEQAAEHLTGPVLQAAIEWARRHDPATADDVESIVKTARARRQPVRKQPYTRKR